MQKQLSIQTKGRGLQLITPLIQSALEGQLPQVGVLNCFIQHTSASLIIQENADPTARRDLEEFLNRLAPDDQPWHQHTLEGADDSSSHMKSSLTSCSLNIPVTDHQLGLGRWQGLYLWEHRHQPHVRNLVLTLY